MDSIRFATSDHTLDELSSYERLLRPAIQSWPESPEKYKALLLLVRLLATADEAWTQNDARDDDGTTNVGIRHILIRPVAGNVKSEILTLFMDLPKGAQGRAAFKKWLMRCVKKGVLQQKKGRYDARANVKNGLSDQTWIDKICAMPQHTEILKHRTSLQLFFSDICEGSFGRSTLRAYHKHLWRPSWR